MRFEDYAREASRALAASGTTATATGITELRARRRRRRTASGLAAFVVLALGIVVVTANLGGMERGVVDTPVGPSQISVPAATLPVEGGGVMFSPPRIEEADSVTFPITLLDGTRLVLTLPRSIADDIQGFEPAATASWELHSCCGRGLAVTYGTVADIYGDRPPDVEHEDADGNPVGFFIEEDDVDYLVFQYGSWVVRAWDGDAGGTQFTEENRELFASLMRGSETADGFLVLDPVPPMSIGPIDSPDARLTTSSGEGDVGVIRWRDCAFEPSSADPDLVTTSGNLVMIAEESGMTSICFPDSSLLVWVSRLGLSEGELETIDLTYADDPATTTTTYPTTTSSTAPTTSQVPVDEQGLLEELPILEEPTGRSVFLSTDTHITYVDIDSATATRGAVHELAPGDPLYRLERRGDVLALYGDVTMVGPAVYVLDPEWPPKPRLVDEAWFFVPGARDSIWLALLDYSSPDTVRALRAIREVDIDGTVLTNDVTTPEGRWPVAAIDDGVLLQGEDVLEIWDPGAQAFVGTAPGPFPVAAWHNRIVSCVACTDVLWLIDRDADTQRSIPLPDGFESVFGYGGAFSPDGRHVALLAFGSGDAGDSLSAVVLVDFEAGTTSVVPGTWANHAGYSHVTWSSDGEWLFYNLGAYKPNSGQLLAYRVGDDTAYLVPVVLDAAEYAGFASD